MWRKFKKFGVQSGGTSNKYWALNFETYQRDVCVKLL